MLIMLVTTECTKKRDKVRIKRIVLDLHDVIADSNYKFGNFAEPLPALKGFFQVGRIH